MDFFDYEKVAEEAGISGSLATPWKDMNHDRGNPEDRDNSARGNH